jgi:hypothetical protein
MFFGAAWIKVRKYSAEVRSSPALLFAIAGVIFWLLLATFFYAFIGNYNSSDVCVLQDGVFVLESEEAFKWEFGDGFYYAVQAGLSIGFGLLSETSNASRLFTCYHILAGASFIGGALSLFATQAMNQVSEVSDSVKKAALQAHDQITKEGRKDVAAHDLGVCMCFHPTHMKKILNEVESDDQAVQREVEEFSKMSMAKRADKVCELLRKAGHVAEEDARMCKEKMMMILGFRKWINEFPVTWLFTTVLLVWLGIGIAFGMIEEEWSFITSLYFAISTCSTAGLQAVTLDRHWHTTFCGFYALIGCPLYGFTVGLYANLLVSSYQKRAEIASINDQLNMHEVDTVAALLDHAHATAEDQTVSQSEFVLMHLLHLGMTSRDQLSDLKECFDKIDTNKSGYLNQDEMWPDLAKQKRKHTKL